MNMCNYCYSYIYDQFEGGSIILQATVRPNKCPNSIKKAKQNKPGILVCELSDLYDPETALSPSTNMNF